MGLLFLAWAVPAVGQEPLDLPAPAGPEAAEHYRDAANLQNNSEFAAADEEWRSFLAKYPDDPMALHARHYLGICLMQQDKLSEAAEQFQICAEKSDKGTFRDREESLMNLGWCRYSLGIRGQKDQVAAALAVFAQLRDDYPTGAFHDQALFYLAECSYLAGQKDEAVKLYRELIKEHPQSKQRADALYALAVALQETNQRAEALAVCEQFFKEFPEHELAAEISLRCGELLFQEGQFEKAVTAFDRAAKASQFELSDHAAMRIGACLESLHEPAKAAEHYATFGDRFPKSQFLAGAALGAARNFYQAQQWEEAATWYQRAGELNSAWQAEVAHGLARIGLQQQRPQDALRIAQAALESLGEKDPGKPQLALDIADALDAMPDRKSDAMKAYVHVADSFPGTTEAGQALYNAAYLALERHNYDEVKAWGQRFLAEYGQHERVADVRHVLAESALQAGRFAESEQAFEQLIKDFPQHADFDRWQARLGAALQGQGKHEAAAKLLADAASQMQSADFQAEAVLRAASSQAEQGDPAGAIKSLSQALAEHPDNPLADRMLLLAATLLKKDGQADAAKENFRAILKRFPNGDVAADAAFGLGELAYAAGDLDLARRRYDAVLKKWPESPAVPLALYGRAWAQLRKGDLPAAIEDFSQLIDRHADHPLVPRSLQGRGLARQRNGDFAAALQDCQAFLATQPEGTSLADSWYVKALCEIGLGQKDEAYRSLQHVDQSFPEYPRRDHVLYELAWLLNPDRPEESMQTFRRLAESCPASKFCAEALVHVGDAEFAAERYEPAATAFQKAIEIGGSDDIVEAAMYKLGYLQFRQREYQGAELTLRGQREKFPQGKLATEALFLLAECAFATKDYPQAVELYQALESAHLESKWSEGLLRLHAGQAAIQTESYPKAMAWLEPIYRQEPASPLKWKARFEMGQALRRMQRGEDAKIAYAEAAENDRHVTGARACFMLGEMLFGEQQLAESLRQFQKLVYGYGGDEAPKEVQAWQNKGALEAGRVAAALAQADPQQQPQLLEKAGKYLQRVIDRDPQSEEGKAAQQFLQDVVQQRVGQRTVP